MRRLTRGDAIEAFGLYDSRCCDSCHDEYDRGVSAPEEAEVDGMTFFVCCRVYEAILKHVDK